MTTEADPYRTLGLARGATLDEIKRAYRRLAKANHPDAAGELALPRFLAIQAAYEQLVGGLGSTGKARRSPAAPRRPWDADPDRSDATRRAYGGRGRTPPPGAGAPGTGAAGRSSGTPGGAGRPSGTTGGAPGATGAAGNGGASGTTGTGGTGTAGARGTDDGRPSWSRRSRASGSSAGGGQARPASGPADGATGGTSGGRRRADRARNKATLGSTSYDGVEGPFEPDWGGASWYGTTSGTYWTLNPKEYADPRKHGPEYQARARRTARSRADAQPVSGAAAPGTDPDLDAAAEPIGASGASGSAATGSAQAEPTHTTTSWWESTAGRAADPGDGPEPTDRPRPTDRRDPNPSVAAPPPPDLGRAFEEIVRAITDVHYGGWRGRVVRALIGWLPIALGLGWLIGELTGCGRFAATCDGSADPIGLALQLAVLALLLAVPVLASLTTMAALTVLGASLVAALILSATGSAADGDSRRAALGFVLVVAWVVGFGAAIWRRLRATPAPTRPVS